MRFSFLLCGWALLAGAGDALAQGSVVAPGPNRTVLVEGEAFYPLGWWSMGTCTDPQRSLFATHRPDVMQDLETIRRAGANMIVEVPFSDGRVLAQAVQTSSGLQYNWYGYTFTDVKGDTAYAGHARPAAYVEGLRWLMDQAHGRGEADAPIYTIVALSSFVAPGYEGTPYDGDDHLTCAAYRDFIETAKTRLAEADSATVRTIPPVNCSGQTGARPFWEWNVRYVVHSLRDHPSLFGWYLWDEPEGISARHLFGIVPPGQPVRRYTGPESLPTPDLLRYVYDRIVEFETEGRPADYQRHPVIVDIATPHAFFSGRFPWSADGLLDPNWSSGPFDRTPDGGYRTPADVLGLEISNSLGYTQPRGAMGPLDWYWDAGLVSRYARMLNEVVVRDSLWSALVIAAQAQLSSEGPHAVAEPLPCEPNDERRARILNDRDLVWHLLAPAIEGLRGHVYYSHALMPRTGPGAEQVRRSNRLIRQFGSARLDSVLRTPAIPSGWSVGTIRIEALTNYFRSDPAFVGPAGEYDPGRSGFSRRYTLNPDAYTAAAFGRSPDERFYGHAAPDAYAAVYPEHHLLRAAYHQYRGRSYLFVSNNYDARIEAQLFVETRPHDTRETMDVYEGRFDLGESGRFLWTRGASRLDVRLNRRARERVLTVGLEPYEARVFRLP